MAGFENGGTNGRDENGDEWKTLRMGTNGMRMETKICEWNYENGDEKMRIETNGMELERTMRTGTNV